MAKSILRRNFILSLAFGFCMGLIFPLFATIFVEYKSRLMLCFFVVGCIIAGIVVGIIAYFINNKTIVKMAKQIKTVLATIRKRDQSILYQLNIDSDDILGELIDCVRKVMESFQDALELLRDTGKKTLTMSAEFEESLSTTSSSIEGVFKVITLIEDAAKDLDMQNTLMEEGFGKLNKSALLNVSNVIELYSNVNEFGQIIFRQSESIENMIKGLDTIKHYTNEDNNVNTLASLSRHLQQSGENTINTAFSVFNGIKGNLEAILEIAERTNLLSINTAIEAARLGERGQGFRIISGNIKELAGEVRVLANSTGEQMEEGEKDLQAVTTALKDALTAQERIIKSISELIINLAAKNGDITTLMGSMEENREHIDSLLNDIKENMQGLRDFVEETHDSLKQVVSTSTVIHTGIHTLTEKSQIIEENEKRSTQLLDGFKEHIEVIERQLK